MLEVCGNSKDVLLLVKEHLQELQFTLRRMVIGESDISAKIAAYNQCRKKLKKQTFKCLQSLRGMTNKAITASDVYSVDSKLMVAVDVLKEARVLVISIVELLLSLISMPWLDRKSAKGSFSAKFMRSSGQSLYDIWDEEEVQSASKRIEGVEIAIEVVEVELECISRRLIQTRVSLLNILTS